MGTPALILFRIRDRRYVTSCRYDGYAVGADIFAYFSKLNLTLEQIQQIVETFNFTNVEESPESFDLDKIFTTKTVVLDVYEELGEMWELDFDNGRVGHFDYDSSVWFYTDLLNPKKTLDNIPQISVIIDKNDN